MNNNIGEGFKYNFCSSEKLLQSVFSLSDKNKKTLGMLPYSAIKKFYDEKKIICATDAQDRLIGYIIFRFVKRKNRIAIIHFCIDENFRRKRIARDLFCFLEERAKEFNPSCILVKCRRDYNLEHFWRSLGFTAINEVPGNAEKFKSILTSWVYFYKEDSLFDFANSYSEQIVIDSCVLINMKNGKDDSILLNKNMFENIEIVVTSEIFNDIEHNNDEKSRRETKEYAQHFKYLTVSIKELYSEINRIKHLWNNDSNVTLSRNDESDLKHIATCIINKCRYFVTNDRKLLSKSEKIENISNLKILTPSELIDELYSQDNILYNHTRLHSEKLTSNRPRLDTLKKIYQQFLIGNEKGRKFLKELEGYYSNPQSYCIKMLYVNKDPILFSVFSNNDSVINIFKIRIIPSQYDTSILYEFLIKKIYSLSEHDFGEIKILDRNFILQNHLLLDEIGFCKNDDGYSKLMLKESLTRSKLKQIVSKRNINKELKDLIDQKLQKNTIENDMFLEKLLWPMVIVDSDMPTYIIPIQKTWAMELFQTNYAKSDMFGASNTSLIINRENVYYSAANRSHNLYGRILWYTSGKDGKEITAYSKLVSTEYGSVDLLYKKYKHLGIFNKSKLIKLSRNKTRRILALKFENTFLLGKPISLDEMREYKISAPQTIRKINSKEILLRLHEK